MLIKLLFLNIAILLTQNSFSNSISLHWENGTKKTHKLVDSGEAREHIFKFKNMGNKAVLIQDNRDSLRSCSVNSCCIKSYTQGVIQNNSEGQINVLCQFKTKDYYEQFQDRVAVTILSTQNKIKQSFQLEVNLEVYGKGRCCLCEYDYDPKNQLRCEAWFKSFACQQQHEMKEFSQLPPFEGCTSIYHSFQAHSNPTESFDYIERVIGITNFYPAKTIISQHYGCSTFEFTKNNKRYVEKNMCNIPYDKVVHITANQALSFGFPEKEWKERYLTPVGYEITNQDAFEISYTQCSPGLYCIDYGVPIQCTRSGISNSGVKYVKSDYQTCCFNQASSTGHSFKMGKKCGVPKCSELEGHRCIKYSKRPKCIDQQGAKRNTNCQFSIQGGAFGAYIIL